MRTLIGGILAALLVATTGNAAPVHADEPAPLRYVNLGDSYSAGAGVTPLDPTAPLLCFRAQDNFAQVIARTIGTRVTDVSCSSADTRHFSTAQYFGVPPQLNAVRADTQLVTMTIGGNDGGVFIGSILTCATLGALTLGLGSPCQDLWGAAFHRTLENRTYPNVRNALTLVRAKAPHARIAVVGYPWTVPATGGCSPAMPLTRADTTFLHEFQAHANAVIARAAAEVGAVFVDMSVVSAGRDACAPASVRWVEPALGSRQFLPVHPNALGEAAMAARTMAVLGLG